MRGADVIGRTAALLRLATRSVRGWMASTGWRPGLNRHQAAKQKLEVEFQRVRDQARRLSAARDRLGRSALAHLDRAALFADWVAETLKGRSFDLCIAHDTLSWEAARTLRRQVGRVLLDAVEYPLYHGRSGGIAQSASDRDLMLLHAVERELAEIADCIVTCSPSVAGWYRRRVNMRSIVVVRNCLDYVEYVPDNQIRRACKLSGDDVLVLYPNTVFPGCGLDRFIAAMPLMEDRIHLGVMGSGSRSVVETLQASVRKNQLESRVHWLPLVRPAHLIRYRMGADFALIPLLPSVPNHFEGLPNRVFESIMSRLPLLTSTLPHVMALVERYDCGRVFCRLAAADVAATVEDALRERSRLRRGAARAASVLNWGVERQRFEPLLVTGAPTPRTLLLANKSMATNQRMYRFARTAAESGHEVTFLCLELPLPELRDERVRYVEMPDEWRRRSLSGFTASTVAKSAIEGGDAMQ